jgi:multimeric flavodoxin WrbA
MKVIALNCSPRKNQNTVKLLNKALEGASEKGADTKLVHLYDQEFKGCTGCLSCKLTKNEKNPLCIMKDSITELLKEMSEADVLIFGSPIYFGDVTAYARAIIERFAYPYFQYSKDHNSKCERTIKTAFIYNMNINEDGMKGRNYAHVFDTIKSYLERLFGHSEYMTACNTMPMKDFSMYTHDYFDVDSKKKSLEDQFPIDLQKAYDMGASLV